jgi:hypothetical protein
MNVGIAVVTVATAEPARIAVSVPVAGLLHGSRDARHEAVLENHLACAIEAAVLAPATVQAASTTATVPFRPRPDAANGSLEPEAGGKHGERDGRV